MSNQQATGNFIDDETILLMAAVFGAGIFAETEQSCAYAQNAFGAGAWHRYGSQGNVYLCVGVPEFRKNELAELLRRHISVNVYCKDKDGVQYTHASVKEIRA